MAVAITAVLGVLALAVGWLAYRRFSRKDEAQRCARLKRRGAAAREAAQEAAKKPPGEAAPKPAAEAAEASGSAEAAPEEEKSPGGK